MHIVINDYGIQMKRWHKTPTRSSYLRVERLAQRISYYQTLTRTGTIYYV